MISLSNVSVTFQNKEQTIKAVRDVTLQVNKGDIFGVIGYSGAGKSTLVRTINLLQRPTEGTIEIKGKNLLELKPKELRTARKKIGMIFQHFNLMASRTIAANVAYPLRKSGLSKVEINQKVTDLLDLVGLLDKATAYPSQLSGGQKQRVAIARSLANDPEILLCDEATSALDPKTTLSILELLKELNEKLSLTIVIITHEMLVIKEICNRVAVMEGGYVVEQGALVSTFTNPKKPITKEFINTADQSDQALAKIKKNTILMGADSTAALVQISYVGERSNDPLIVSLYKKFNVTASILHGNVEILQETPVGKLILSLSGESDQIEEAILYLKNNGMNVEKLNS